jgi:hypothetical protein
VNKDDLLYEIIDRVGKTQDAMKDILIEMKADLKYHIRRTDLLEEEVNILKERIPPPFPWKKVGIVISVLGGAVGLAIKILSL